MKWRQVDVNHVGGAAGQYHVDLFGKQRDIPRIFDFFCGRLAGLPLCPERRMLRNVYPLITSSIDGMVALIHSLRMTTLRETKGLGQKVRPLLTCNKVHSFEAKRSPFFYPCFDSSTLFSGRFKCRSRPFQLSVLSPFFQLQGTSLSVCKASNTRRTSSTLRPTPRS